MNHEARLQEELTHARRRIARLESVIREMKAGRSFGPRDAITLAADAHDAEGVMRAVGRISSWLSESEIFLLRESWQAQTAQWDEPNPELRDQVDRVLDTAMREVHEFARKS